MENCRISSQNYYQILLPNKSSAVHFSSLRLSTLWANLAKYKIRQFMQSLSLGDNLHEMPNPISWDKLEKMF